MRVLPFWILVRLKWRSASDWVVLYSIRFSSGESMASHPGPRKTAFGRKTKNESNQMLLGASSWMNWISVKKKDIPFWDSGVLNCLGTVTDSLFSFVFFKFISFMTFCALIYLIDRVYISLWSVFQQFFFFWHTVFSIWFLASAFGI